MQIESLIRKIVDHLPGLTVEEKGSKFVTLGALRAMMLLSAVDGNISQQEMKAFWDHAQRCTKSASTSRMNSATSSSFPISSDCIARYPALVRADFQRSLRVPESMSLQRCA